MATIPPPAAVTAKFESVPLVAVISLSAKLVLALLSVNVIVAVAPVATVVTLDVMTTVGATVSTVIVALVVEAVLLLPAASVKTPAGTLSVPLVVELAAGVKTTV